MSESLYALQPYILWAINSVLLAKYYSTYLTARNSKIPGAIFYSAFGAAYFAVQFIAANLLSGIGWPVASVANVAILIVSVFAISLAFFKGSFKLCVFLLLSFFAVQTICEFIMLGVGKLFGNAHRYIVDSLVANGYFTSSEGFSAFLEGYAVFQFISTLLIHAAIIVLTLRAITKRFTDIVFNLSSSDISLLSLPCIPGLIIPYIIRALLVDQNEQGVYLVIHNNPVIDVLMPVSGFVFLFSIIATVRIFHKLARLHNEETERSVMQKQVQLLQRQINDVDSIYTEIRGFRHDVRSHISNILVLANAIVEGNADVKGELEQYMKKVEDTLSKFEFTYKTGNSISDIIIHQKYLESAKAGIDFSADFSYPQHLNIDAYDLAIILNNALENAIEACAGADNGYIRLCAYTKGKMFFIDVENSFVKAISLDKNTGLPESSKPDKSAHGMGISNIRRCARRYFGDIDFSVSEGKDCYIFRLTVMLQGTD